MPKASIKSENNGAANSVLYTPMTTPNAGAAPIKVSNEPTLQPLSTDGQTGVNAVFNGKKVVQTWSIDQNRNFWANVTDIGWKKVNDSSDANVVAFGLLCTSARTMNSNVDVTVDDTSGKITQIYVW